ncbi:MAG: hypothetical protein ABW223_10215 [Rariglobus sp.]
MTKALLLISVLSGIAYGLWRHNTDDAPSVIEDVSSLPESAPTPLLAVMAARESYIEVRDKNARVLNCKVLARRGPFFQVERESDRGVFLLRIDNLDAPSRGMLEPLQDFNSSALNSELYKLAKAELRVELVTVPEMNTFRCQYTGEIMKSSTGLMLDSYRENLKKLGVNYREVPLTVKRSKEGGFYLPLGISKIPCLRIGETITDNPRDAGFQTLLVDHYVKLNTL